MEFDINKYNIFCYTNENIKFQNAYSANLFYSIPIIWNGVVNYHLLMFVFFHSKNMSLILNVKVFIESLTKNINFEVNLSFISFNV